MAKTMSVQVKKCQLRNKPSFLGKLVTKLEYGDKVEITQEENSWVEVLPGKKKSGWVHVSALSEKALHAFDCRKIEDPAAKAYCKKCREMLGKDVDRWSGVWELDSK